MRAACRLRRRILGSSLPLGEFTPIITTTPHDVDLLTTRRGTHAFYDFPNPLADELDFEGS
jgi:hypothetical protein